MLNCVQNILTLYRQFNNRYYAEEAKSGKKYDAYINDEGLPIVNHEHLNRSKLRIDTRKWLAAKFAPRIYGPRILPTACASCEMKLELTKLSDDQLIAQAKEIFASADERLRIFENTTADVLAIESSE